MSEVMAYRCSSILLLLLSLRIEPLDDLRLSWLWADADKTLVGILFHALLTLFLSHSPHPKSYALLIPSSHTCSATCI